MTLIEAVKKFVSYVREICNRIKKFVSYVREICNRIKKFFKEVCAIHKKQQVKKVQNNHSFAQIKRIHMKSQVNMRKPRFVMARSSI